MTPHPARGTGIARSLLPLLFAALSGGCASWGSAPEESVQTLPLPPGLHAQGIPPIPMSQVRRVQAYTDFRGHEFVDWHPERLEMLVAHRAAGASVVQVHRLTRPMGEPEPLTEGPDPVRQAMYEPRHGHYIVFERSTGGNEAAQIHRLDLDTRRTTLLTDPDERHDMIGWLHRDSVLLYSAVPLDRTAQGGQRARLATTIWRIDPLQPAQRRKVAELPGGGWGGGGVSPDDRLLALTRWISASESEVWLMELATGQARRVLPLPGDASPSSHLAGEFSADGRQLFFSSDRAGEFREAMALDLAQGTVQRLSGHVPWDVAGGTRTRDGRWTALQFNVEGRDELRLFEAAGGWRERALPELPPGSVGTAVFHPAAHGRLAFSMTSARHPSQIYTLDVEQGTVVPWTQAQAAPGVDMTTFGEQRVVRWSSFDGRTISGLLSQPPARFAGRRPVVIDIHGGPAAQAKFGFLGRENYLVNELGVALLRPNVRGSTGFGKTFQQLDDGLLREDSVKDIGALLDWIALQPGLDPSRVVVTGGSYGGYMSLAVAVHHGQRIAGAVNVVGISHFVSFLNRTESYRRDLRRTEYGDERDPAMRDFLHRISPLTEAHRISRPLFVVHGRNDPRVPYTEAEQIVEKVRAGGTPVWYLLADNEGHGFARKENADFRFHAWVRFVEQLLLK